MCGICGVLNKSGQPVSQDLLQTMARTLRHRGPDEEGYQTMGPVGLGFQRLSIIDLKGGRQPMSNEDDTLWIVFNGEIYNFQSLRNDLETSGRHRFKTRSDTEVILHLYEDYGEKCVEHLRGMFAFAIWNTKTKTLFMARDRFGKKPLVYADLPGAFLFGSELKALLPHPSMGKDLDYQALDLYLTYQYIPSPHTIFQQIRKLPPAHTLVWKDGTFRIQRYWEPTFLPKTTLRMEDAQEQMLDKLRESVRLRMIADVPLGAFLSGGIDSSTVVGMMSEQSPAPIKTFSIGFEDERYSELPFARRIAQQFHCDHHEFIVKPDNVEILPKLAWHYGEPYADASALPSYYLSKLTREHITVALNGDGGDENFAGYPRYQAMAFMRTWQRLPLAIRRTIFKTFSLLPDGFPPYSSIWRLKRLLSMGLQDSRTTYVDSLCYFHESQKKDLYSPFLKDQVKGNFPPDYLNKLLKRSENLSGIDAYLYTDMLSYLPENLMVKMDIATMANSLEVRSPFLDHEFVELVAQFPPEWKLHGLFGKKYILKKALKGLLPDDILFRKKQGFVIPMSKWFREDWNPYLEGMLLSPKALSRGLFEQSAIRKLLADHTAGKTDHGYRLWALLMLEQWFQVYIDQ